MIPFETTPEERIALYEIATMMKSAGLSSVFIDNAVKMANEYQGTFELMLMWSQAENQKEKDELVSDIQEEVDDWKDASNEVVEKPKIVFDDIESIANDVREFKAKLKVAVDKNGGVSSLAKKTGIPQPSLSKFFNSASRPRRSFVYRIAKALELTDSDIAFDWYV